jgi:ABC-type Na+ transport system ATPase subunit NatA
VASQINERLGPHIEVTIERLGVETEVVNSIGECLKGSGMHSSTLAPQLAKKLTPREFVEYLELRDANSISQYAQISPERAERLIEELSRAKTDSILTATVEDTVRFALLDGGEYKTTENLSVGQRCTVILPILLGHHERTLVVDQPEDHLDNAFIVDTLLEAIKESKRSGQLIFSTHNANIPVLGDADRVVLLGSDGRNGFVLHAGALEEPESIRAITDVMEGGHEAFVRRARFYEKRFND